MERIEVVGKITESERDQIRNIFEKKNGLLELFKIIDPDNEKLYKKLTDDIQNVNKEFQKWWDEKALFYKWKSVDGCSWEIDFNDCSVFLSKN